MYDSKCIGTILKHAVPQASATILGSEKYDQINGTISFYDIGSATLVTFSISGIPFRNGYCKHPILGIHIHEGRSCTGNSADPFADAGTHYNPENCEHPIHAGDLPSVFVSDGIAWSAFTTTRFTIKEVLGRTVILHSMSDDFHSQPAGNSGKKIACGIIKKTNPFPVPSPY